LSVTRVVRCSLYVSELETEPVLALTVNSAVRTSILQKRIYAIEILVSREAFAAIMEGKLLPLSRENKNQEAEAVLKTEYEDSYNRYRDAVLKLQDYTKESADRSGAIITEDVNSAVTGIIAGLIIALVVGSS